MAPTLLRPELSTLPVRIARLPVDPRGYPIPWFVERLPDGTPEFRAMDPKKFVLAIRDRRCWVCGETLGAYKVFVVGPMCGINRTSSEPPSHRDCAVWSARNCPFLSRPQMVRRENDLPDNVIVGEAALDRNPGVTLLWTTRTFIPFKAPGASGSGVLLTMGEPLSVEWFAEGRPATRAEVLASIADGMPALERACDMETTPLARQDAHAALDAATQAFARRLPAA